MSMTDFLGIPVNATWTFIAITGDPVFDYFFQIVFMFGIVGLLLSIPVALVNRV